MVGVPVIINHKDLNDKNVDDERVGVVNSVWYDNKDGWYWCDGIIWDETAQNLITDKNWSVSCSYDVKTANDEGGSENNIKYDMEFLDGVFTHLALVNNPRYERANIVFNSKTVIENNNFNPNQKRNERGQWVKDGALIQQKKDNLIPIEVSPKDIPQFDSKEDLGNWFKKIFKDLGSVTVTDTGIKIDLYGGNAEREAFKRRLQQEPNKAVAKAFEEVITKSIKVDEREKDENHKHDQDIYFNKLKLGKDNYDVNLFVDYLEPNREYRYAGHKTTKIDNKISTRDTQVINHIMLTKVDNFIINDVSNNFNPNVKENEEMNVGNDKWITKYDKEGEPYHVNIDETGDDFEKETRSTKKDEERHQKVRDLEDKAYKDFKTMYDNYIDKDGMEGWGGIPASQFDKAKEKFNKKYKEEFDKLKSDRFVSFEEFAKRENNQPDKKEEKKSLLHETFDKEFYDKYNPERKELDKDFVERYSDKKEEKKEDKVAETKILEGGVKESTDEHGRIIYSKKNSNKKVKIHKNGNFYLASYGQELKDDDGYTEFQVFPSASGKSFKTEEGARRWALKQLNVNNDKEQEMALLDELKKLITKVENGKESDMEKIENEKVDKRKLIDEVGGILKGKVDDEIIRTIIGKLEKVAYEKSEADTADNEKEEKAENCDKKVKNEEEKDEKEVKEIKEEVKEDVENKCKNSVDNSKTDYFAKLNEIYNSAAQAKQELSYVSREDREKAAEEYFAK